MNALSPKEDNSLLHDKSKLLIISRLAASNDPLSFTELLERTQLTNGNLSSHLKKLEEKGAVQITKSFVNKRPLTTVQITVEGKTQLKDYIAYLKSVLESVSKLD